MMLENKTKALLTAALIVIANVDAFLSTNTVGKKSSSMLSSIATMPYSRATNKPSFVARLRPLYATTTTTMGVVDDEVEKLQSMAANLRAEASMLETEQQNAVKEAAGREFRRFDTDMDGEITLEELKAGLEKNFKMEVPGSQIEQLMKDLDVSGDGALQLEEFVGVDRIRNKLDANVRAAKDAERQAQKAARAEQEAADLAQAQAAIVNDNAPTATDKALSVIPYLFPLLDSLQYARYLVLAHPNNPLSLAAGAAFGAYQTIPFGGLIAFFSLIILSGNPQINKLVRFNMVQAAYMDTAMFIPITLLSLVATAVPAITGNPLPPVVGELATDATFFVVLAAVAYSSVSSLLFGETPNKLPILSNMVEQRQLTADEFDAETGRYIGPPEMRKNDDDDNDDEANNDKKQQ